VQQEQRPAVLGEPLGGSIYLVGEIGWMTRVGHPVSKTMMPALNWVQRAHSEVDGTWIIRRPPEPRSALDS
jgi:hypothetical protein